MRPKHRTINDIPTDISTAKLKAAMQCLANNGVAPENTPFVLQSIGQILLKTDLMPKIANLPLPTIRSDEHST